MYDASFTLKIAGHYTLVNYSSQQANRATAQLIIEKFAQEDKRELGYNTLNILEVTAEDAEIEIFPRSNIMRLRRITGYLSVVENFNDAKKVKKWTIPLIHIVAQQKICFPRQNLSQMCLICC